MFPSERAGKTPTYSRPAPAPKPAPVPFREARPRPLSSSSSSSASTSGGGGGRSRETQGAATRRQLANNKESLWYREEMRRASSITDPVDKMLFKLRLQEVVEETPSGALPSLSVYETFFAPPPPLETEFRPSPPANWDVSPEAQWEAAPEEWTSSEW